MVWFQHKSVSRKTRGRHMRPGFEAVNAEARKAGPRAALATAQRNSEAGKELKRSVLKAIKLLHPL